MEYRREIDGLRALAVLPVILFHAGAPMFSGGFVGVDVFFVISGYLITSIILAEKESGTFSLSRFYIRRMRRILPALFFVVATCLPLAWYLMLPSELVDFSKSLISVPLFVSNYYFQRDTGYFAATADEKPLLHTWSLAVEEQYYLLFPALVCVLWAMSRRLLPLVLAVCALASIGFAVWDPEADLEKLFFDSRGRFWEILAGALLAVLTTKRSLASLPLSIRNSLSLLGLSLVVGSVVLFDETVFFPSWYTLVPVLGAVLILAAATPETLAGKILGNKALVGVGLISYSTYLWHQPLLAFGRMAVFPELETWQAIALALASLPLAYLSWRFIERPFRNSAIWSSRSVVAGACCLSLVTLSLGIWGNHKEGFEWRFARREGAVRKNFEKEIHARVKLSRPGRCHYTGLHGRKNIHEFLKGWDCKEDPQNPQLQRVPLVVVGDSHAADIVASFKTNGYLPAHLAGSGCSIVPKLMSKKCRLLFDHAKDLVAKDPYYSHFVLVNRMSAREVTPDAMASITQYWQLPGKRVVFLTSRPEFPKYKRALIFRRTPQVQFKRYEASSQPENVKALQSAGVTVIDSKKVFCSITPDCASTDTQGNPLTTDGHHLTRRGAELFGQKMLEENAFPLTPPQT